MTALIGPSGCGKSTFLRCLNRMNDTIEGARVEGEIKLDGQDIYDADLDVVELRARVGMVFQKPNPFPKSIYENVAYGPRIHGLARGKAELDGVVEASLRRAGLWEEVKDRLAEPGTGLSGGQQQRLCIARAIAVSPEVILMDEPCSALDPIATARIEELIDELRANFTHRHRHPLDAAGRPRLAAHGVLPPRPSGRGRRDRADLHQPAGQAHPGLHHRPLRLSCERVQGDRDMTEHIVSSFDDELNELARSRSRDMGGLAEKLLTEAVIALDRRDQDLARSVIAADNRIDALQHEVEEQAITDDRQAPADGAVDLREIIDGDPDRRRSRAHRRSRQEHRQARRRRAGRADDAEGGARHRPDEPHRARAAQERARRLHPA